MVVNNTPTCLHVVANVGKHLSNKGLVIIYYPGGGREISDLGCQ